MTDSSFIMYAHSARGWGGGGAVNQPICERMATNFLLQPLLSAGTSPLLLGGHTREAKYNSRAGWGVCVDETHLMWLFSPGTS